MGLTDKEIHELRMCVQSQEAQNAMRVETRDKSYETFTNNPSFIGWTTGTEFGKAFVQKIEVLKSIGQDIQVQEDTMLADVTNFLNSQAAINAKGKGAEEE